MSSAKASETDLGGLSFEAALERLEAIVQRLESGEVNLEESIRIYEEGVKIKAFCEKKLAEAQDRVEKIVLSPDGSVTTEPTEIP
ncbi:MAG TPA: exodeoxyribonuclease VII small subunit [Alphaproteobacteria bacterium]|nr:exodeoxyribonuclease VII small subunit [Alphaproteobacteria bacterium]